MTKQTKRSMELAFFVILFMLMPLITIITFHLDSEIQSPLAVQKKVLAFYYSWYGNTTDYTDPAYNITDFTPSWWSHWNYPGLNPPATIASTDYPELGAYDCSDPNLIKTHFKWANDSRIDGFICTWWGINDATDIAFQNILNIANNVSTSLNFTVYYEAYQDRLLSLPVLEREIIIAQELKYILETYGSDPYFLKINNVPVIFIYLTYASPFSLWQNVISNIKKEHACYFIGDVLPCPSVKDELVQIFDGIHIYNPTSIIEYQRILTGSSEWDVSAIYESMGQTAHFYNKLYAATVIPGYNDTVIRDPGIVIERNGMETYDRLWETAIQASADWILITSFNEWHEGTEIEPSLEYNNLYINSTFEWSNRFHDNT